MRVVRSRWQLASAAALALLGAGCAAAPPIGVQPLARPGAAWPVSEPECVLAQEVMSLSCQPELDVTASLDGRVIARVARRELAAIVWHTLPLLGAGRVAAVMVTAEGITLKGWASLEGQTFELASTVSIARGHVWIPAGAMVDVLGTSGDGVALSVPTPFVSPKTVEVIARCDAFGRTRSSTRVPIGPPFARTLGLPMELRESADGPVVLTFTPQVSDLLVAFERRGRSIHVAGGAPHWMQVLDGDQPFLFDGWVDAAGVEIVREEDPFADRDTGCELRDTRDTCDAQGVSPGTALWLGAEPGIERIGEITGAVVLGTHVGGFVAVSTVNEAIVPPPGQLFWVEESAVRDACEETGCACDG